MYKLIALTNQDTIQVGDYFSSDGTKESALPIINSYYFGRIVNTIMNQFGMKNVRCFRGGVITNG